MHVTITRGYPISSKMSQNLYSFIVFYHHGADTAGNTDFSESTVALSNYVHIVLWLSLFKANYIRTFLTP